MFLWTPYCWYYLIIEFNCLNTAGSGERWRVVEDINIILGAEEENLIVDSELAARADARKDGHRSTARVPLAAGEHMLESALEPLADPNAASRLIAGIVKV